MSLVTLTYSGDTPTALLSPKRCVPFQYCCRICLYFLAVWYRLSVSARHCSPPLSVMLSTVCWSLWVMAMQSLRRGWLPEFRQCAEAYINYTSISIYLYLGLLTNLLAIEISGLYYPELLKLRLNIMLVTGSPLTHMDGHFRAASYVGL